MAMILQFPMTQAQAMRDPALRSLRDKLGALTADESHGLRALCTALDSDDEDDIEADTLRDYLAADIDAETWKRYLRAFRQLDATATAE